MVSSVFFIAKVREVYARNRDLARGNFWGSMGSVKKSTKEKGQTLDVLQVGHVVSDGGKVGRKRKRGSRYKLTEEVKKKMIQGVRLGMPIERVIPLCGCPGDGGAWRSILVHHPGFETELQNAKLEGEIELLGRVHGSEQGWQGSAWLLERARGYVARASMEHTGRGGSTLTIAHQLLSSVAERER